MAELARMAPDAARTARAYNLALASDEIRAEFHRTFPGSFLGIVNAEQRARCPGTPPEFGLIDRGDFYAFRAAGSTSRYQVVPRFGRAVTPERWNGGWDYLFNLQGSASQRGGRTVLLQPAVFEFEGGKWALQRKGSLLGM